MDILKELVSKIQKFDKLKEYEFVKLLDDKVIDQIEKEIPSDDQLYVQLEEYCYDYMIDYIIVVLKSHTLNKVGNVVDFTTDKAI